METSSRRKACDTCFKKKIKCDMLKPACSNCQLYKVPCHTTIIRRRAVPVPPKEANTEKSASNDDSIEARLIRIEAKLDKLGESGTTVSADQLLGSISGEADEPAISAIEASIGTSDTDILVNQRETVYRGESNIPPLTEILPVVNDYFRDFNPAMPLFHQLQFMQMLYEFYSKEEQTQKSRAIWAAINVVLALGYRSRTAETDKVTGSFDDVKVKRCIDNAQKELDELVTREEDTLGIQVLVGLVILFQTNPDQKPASVLIGTAVRLAHRLQLHVKPTSPEFGPEEARHRSNIFWICYCLDKDISLRSKVPSIQSDDDVDLDLPGTEFGDDGNYLQSIDGKSQLNYLRARVQLAYVQGKVYDYLLSNRSKKISSKTRQERVSHLVSLLERWLQAIPSSLRLESMTTTLGKATLSHMILLYHTYLMCSTTLNGLYSLQSPWVQAMNRYSREPLINFDFQSDVCMRHQQPMLPGFWSMCVAASRGCLAILNNDIYKGCNLWLSCCAYFSAFVVLLANVVYFPLHDLVEYDRELTRSSLVHLENMLDCTGSESFKRLHLVLTGMEEAADFAIVQAKNVTETYEQTYETVSLAPQPYYSSNSSTEYDMSSSGMTPESSLGPEFAWTQNSNAAYPGSTYSGMDFGEVVSLPAFMRGFS